MPLTRNGWQQRWAAIQVKGDMDQMEVLKQDQTAISTINAGTGTTEAGVTVFELTILSILEFYGVEWSEFQTREAAEMMHSEYYWFSLAELKHFALRVKKADFGKITQDYSRFAPKHLMQCATVYAEEALHARAQFNFLGHEPAQEDPNAEYVPIEKVKEALQSMADKWQGEIDEANKETEAEYQRLKEQMKKAS